MSYIYERCTAYDAIDRARKMERLQTDTTSGNFTAAAVRALFEYHEHLAEELAEPIELDVIAWCCDWAEYGDALEAAEQHGYVASEYFDAGELDEDAVEQHARAWLDDQTTVLDADAGSIVVASF